MATLLDSLAPTALKAVAAIADCGSVTRAAELLGLTQPALSYQIKHLEAATGTQLFERTSKGMVPTPAGERLVRAARAVRNEIERAEHDLQLLESGTEGRLRISSECFTAYHWLAGVLSTFRQAYPSVQIEIDVDPSQRRLDALRGGQVEIVLTTAPPSEPRLTVSPLFDDEIVAVMPPDHPLAERAFLKPRDFIDQSLLLWNIEQSDLINLVLRPAGVRPQYATEVRITEAIVEMVKSGLGITVLASWTVQPELDSGELVSVRVTKNGLRRRWHGVWRNSPSTPPYVAHFLSVLSETLEGPMSVGQRRRSQLKIAAG